MSKLSVFRTLPREVYVGCSGGVDSIVLAHFLKKSGRTVRILFVDHGCGFSSVEYDFVSRFCTKNSLEMCISGETGVKYSSSKEENWREMRYKFFHAFDPSVVCVGHHLGDVLETYLMTSFTGEGHYMRYANKNVVRPFILQRKEDILAYAKENGLEWLEDPSNKDVSFTARNKIRHEVVPKVLELNPGIYTTMKKNVIRKESEV